MTDPSIVRYTLADVRTSLRPEVVARGEAYARGGRVSNLKLTNGGNSITARVRGSQAAPYDVTAYVSRSRSGRTFVSGYCECPVAADCKHVAATLISALGKRAAPAVAFVSAPPPREPVAKTADPRVDLWLADICASASVAGSEATPGDERIAYVFVRSKPLSRSFPVDIIVARLTKAQRWTKIRDATSESLAALTARAVGADDAIVGRFMQVYERTYHERASLGEEILRRIIVTGRAHFERLDAPALELGPPRSARVVWVLASDGTQRPSLEFEDARLVALPGAAPWYVDPDAGVAGPIEAGLPTATLGTLLAAPALDREQALHVRDSFARTDAGLALPLPLEIGERVVHVRPVPTLRLRSIEVPSAPSFVWHAKPSPPRTIDLAEWSFAYGDATIDPSSPAREVRCIVGRESLVYERSRDVERLAAQRLTELGFVIDTELRDIVRARAICLRFVEEKETLWPAFLHRSVAELRAQGWRIQIDVTFRHRIVDLANDDTWRATVEERSGGWFDVAIGLDVDGTRLDLLPILRDLAQRPAGFDDLERLGPGDYYYAALQGADTFAFPAERLQAILRTLIELGDPDALRTDGTLRLPRVRAAVVNELEAASGLRWNAPERLRELGARLSAFSGIDRVAVPPSFRGELRAYQRDGLDWLQFLAAYGLGGILADDMGLGKSVQTLAHLLCEQEAGRLTQPALLVVPTSLVHNWRDEAARFAPSLRVLPLHGPGRAQRFSEIADHDLVITTYALLLRDVVLHERAWHALILDEAQALKNPQVKAAQVATSLSATHRLCLTGTPVENHLGDLWSLFSIVLPGALGDRKQFGRVFRTPIEKHADTNRKRALAERIAPFLLRRVKEAVASELPEKSEMLQRVELLGAQRDLYETVRLAMHDRVREEIAERGLARSQIVILDALLKLRQVCCDPRLLPERLRKEAASVKLALLLEMLPQMIEEGRRILIFSQFTSMLDLIEPALEALGIAFVVLTGRTRDRESVVKRFQSGEIPVFLISLKAGGTGLNLTAADTVIHYDPWWNPAVERQATDRAHRIGQTQHVFVYKLIAAGTVEEKIVELQARKAELAAAIFSEKAASGGARFAAEDVERLFAPLET